MAKTADITTLDGDLSSRYTERRVSYSFPSIYHGESVAMGRPLYPVPVISEDGMLLNFMACWPPMGKCKNLFKDPVSAGAVEPTLLLTQVPTKLVNQFLAKSVSCASNRKGWIRVKQQDHIGRWCNS